MNNQKQRIIPLDELVSLVQLAEDYSARYDIPEEVYHDLIAAQEDYGEFLKNNPACYATKEEWEKAQTHSLYIRCLLEFRITEIMEYKHKIG